MQLREEIERALVAFIDREQVALSAIGPELAPISEATREFLTEGKRLRPLFAYWANRACGGVHGDELVKAVSSLEFLHACALIHDDVMDGSDTRRGKPAIHHRFATLHRQESMSGNAETFGLSSAVLLGDLCLVWADRMLNESGLDHVVMHRLNPVYDEMRVELMAGQYLDVLEQALATSSVERSLRIARHKSGKYTVERPLHFGAVIAGADTPTLELFSRYGLPLGEAFQLRDDILGVFGDPSETGKPAGDDLREGKRTVLIAHAVNKASAAQSIEIRKHLGDPHLSPDGVHILREIIRETGALAEVEEIIEESLAESIAAISSADLDIEAVAVLKDLAIAATRRVL